MTNKTGIWIILGILFLGGGAVAISYKKPRGLRNNNPGNIRISSTDWKGKVPLGQNSDGEFEQFTHIVYGVRALIKNLTTWISRGQNTISSLINTWAPGHENNTPAYIKSVSKQTGLWEYQQLTGDKDTLYKLSKAIALHENGVDIITKDLFEQAWKIV